MPNNRSPKQIATVYWFRFHVQLEDRIRDLLTVYPDVSSPNFLSWEGEQLTGADTSARLRHFLAALRADTTAITLASTLQTKSP